MPDIPQVKICKSDEHYCSADWDQPLKYILKNVRKQYVTSCVLHVGSNSLWKQHALYFYGSGSNSIHFNLKLHGLSLKLFEDKKQTYNSSPPEKSTVG